jgi:hypothetical protein
MATLRQQSGFAATARVPQYAAPDRIDPMRSNLGVQSPPLPLFTDLRDFRRAVSTRAAAPHGRRTERRDRNAGQHNDISHPLATLRLYFVGAVAGLISSFRCLRPSPLLRASKRMKAVSCRTRKKYLDGNVEPELYPYWELPACHSRWLPARPPQLAA